MYITIEVSSVSKVDTDFYISKNEVETSILYQEDYRLFRIYDSLSAHPKFYIASGRIEDNFYLEPSTYTARYKWNVQ